MKCLFGHKWGGKPHRYVVTREEGVGPWWHTETVLGKSKFISIPAKPRSVRCEVRTERVCYRCGIVHTKVDVLMKDRKDAEALARAHLN